MIEFSAKDLFLVTGASSGSGRATALLLNKLGAKVIASARNRSKLQRLKDESAYPEHIIVEPKDLTENINTLPEWAATLSQKIGKYRGLVYSAGILNLAPLSMENYESMISIFDLNYFAGVSLIKGMTHKKVRSEHMSIVFISSTSSLRGTSGLSSYSASKGAINSAMRCLAREYGRYNIRINAVLPGTLENAMPIQSKDFSHLDYEKFHKQAKENYCLKGTGTGEDVACLCAFLLSDKSRWITGQNIVIDGGESL
jgi:NAD(P)-dependent dehydrogenase (short-subunit alcohol dehydrogenase family)